MKIVDASSLIKLRSSKGLLSVQEIEKKERPQWNPSRIFGWALFQYNEDLEFAKKYFKDQVVVDIGSGTDISIYRVCCIASARGYIGVDYNHDYDKKLMENLLSEEYWKKHDREFKFLGERLNHSRDVPVSLVYEKAQNFLRRLPPKSVSIYAGGIDVCMIPSNEEARDLEKQIVRVIHPEGAFIGHATRLFNSPFNYVPEKGLILLSSKKGYPDLDVRIPPN